VQLSVVIVNYNVCDLLLNAVVSLNHALAGIDGEIIVVDNASTDGAVETLNRLFPRVITVQLDKNLGFGAANNIGIERATGDYVLLINPDTIVQEETLRTMLEFMEGHPGAVFAGCKILNPDGSFEPASKRGFPSPWSSFCRVFGLSRLFPGSRLFGGYNLTHLDPDRPASVEALSGCFMFCRADALRQLGGFDTDFFMYGEDLDLCYRAKQRGGEIWYYPATSIVHLKGESTRRSSIDALATFYDAMEIFARKHFRTSTPLLALIRAGIWIRRAIARLQERLPQWGCIPVDITATFIGFMIGSALKFGAPFNYPPYAFPAVIILPPLIFVITLALAGGYNADESLPVRALFGYLAGFFVLSTLPYFFPAYAFSRGVVIITTLVATLVGVSVRFFWLLYKRTYGSESIRRVAFLSRQETGPEIRRSVRRLFLGKPVTISGTIAPTFTDLERIEGLALGSMESIGKIIAAHRLTDIAVVDSTLSYSEVLRAMSLAGGRRVRFHIVRSPLQIDEEPVEGRIRAVSAHGRRVPSAGFAKHFRDRAISFLMMVLFLPVVYLSGRTPVARFGELWKVLAGKRPLVGGGDDPNRQTGALFTIAALYRDEALSPQETAQVENYYATNASLLLDCEILLAAFRLRNLPDNAASGPAGNTVRQGIH
jgi:GT2 family glycosyltransferase